MALPRGFGPRGWVEGWGSRAHDGNGPGAASDDTPRGSSRPSRPSRPSRKARHGKRHGKRALHRGWCWDWRARGAPYSLGWEISNTSLDSWLLKNNCNDLPAQLRLSTFHWILLSNLEAVFGFDIIKHFREFPVTQWSGDPRAKEKPPQVSGSDFSRMGLYL